MKITTRLLTWFDRWIAVTGREHLWSELRTMDQGFLTKAGFVPELLEKGADAWPWRSRSDDSQLSNPVLFNGALIGKGEPQVSRKGPEDLDEDPGIFTLG
jgi:hypothetical protein